MSVDRRSVIIIGDYRSATSYLNIHLRVPVERYERNIVFISHPLDIDRARGRNPTFTRITEAPYFLSRADHGYVIAMLSHYEYLDRSKIKDWLEGNIDG